MSSDTSRFFKESEDEDDFPESLVAHHKNFIEQLQSNEHLPSGPEVVDSPEKSNSSENHSSIVPKGSSLFVPESEDEQEDGYVLFESQIQAIIPDIPTSRCKVLFDRFKDEENSVIAAVNAYYDGADAFDIYVPPAESRPWAQTTGDVATEVLQKSSIPQSKSVDITTRVRSAPATFSSSPIPSKKRGIDAGMNRQQSPQQFKWRRFIGTLQVVAWATRPTMSAIPFGTPLTISKSAVSTESKRRRSGHVASYIKLIQDAHIPTKKKEIGRLPEDIATILFPLIDQDICDFETTVVLCDGRLSTGDSFIVQLDCYLTSKIFEKNREKSDDFNDDLKQMRNGGFNQNSHETAGEIAIRKRQEAMLKLFNKLDFQVQSPAGDEKNDEVEVIDLDDDDDDVASAGSQDKPESQPVDQMNLNQLKEFYRRTQTEQILETLPETETKESFKLQLRSYQKQGLTWMMRSERELEKEDTGELINPLWKEFKWPRDRSWIVMRDETRRPKFEEKHFYGNLYSGEFSLEKPVLKSVCRGGILADEMGLGKTVSTLSLLHSVPYDKDYTAEQARNERYAFATTLVILPMSLLQQWQDEFKKANGDENTFLVYYGGETGNDLRSQLCRANAPLVVFTTYGTVQAEWSRLVKDDVGNEVPQSGLYSVKFFRIVLDEGHNIRNRMAKTTKAIYDLKSSRKWILTGTPIINRLDDLYSLIKFLELEPWSNISYWNTFVTTPFEKKDYKQSLDVVQAILEPVLLRRTKNMKKNGKALVELPPKEVVIERIKFSPREKNLYGWFLARAENSVRDGLQRGDLLKKYTMILVHILRLRQVCCHTDLIRGGGDEMDEDISSKTVAPLDIPEELLGKNDDSFSLNDLNMAKAKINEMHQSIDNLECSICTAQGIGFDDIAFTECGHAFCLSCILEYCNYREMHGDESRCPNCRSLISSSRLLQPKKIDAVVDTGNKFGLQRYDDSLRSSKLNALLSHLRIIRDTSPNEKVVVFSQFSTFLDVMEREISKEHGVTVLKFHGGMSLEKRSAILKEFKAQRDSITVLLLSLKAGGVGLNLTEASRAFMCDPWWSPSVEDQAIDRIHRIGQSSNVKVVRFIMEGSIEEKMLRIQERKRTIGEAVEADEEERRKRRVEEIQVLFEAD